MPFLYKKASFSLCSHAPWFKINVRSLALAMPGGWFVIVLSVYLAVITSKMNEFLLWMILGVIVEAVHAVQTMSSNNKSMRISNVVKPSQPSSEFTVLWSGIKCVPLAHHTTRVATSRHAIVIVKRWPVAR
jgi:hypothetical protein